MILGVISDTHGLLRPEALEALQGSEHIVHAGDVGSPDILHQLEAIAPVTAVRGNIDTGRWADPLPYTRTLAFEGTAIYIIHILDESPIEPASEGIDVVCYGHSHKPAIETRDGVLFLNPGSAGPRRFNLPVSVARLDIGRGGAEARIVELNV